jgi:hypothetical protein
MNTGGLAERHMDIVFLIVEVCLTAQSFFKSVVRLLHKKAGDYNTGYTHFLLLNQSIM